MGKRGAWPDRDSGPGLFFGEPISPAVEHLFHFLQDFLDGGQALFYPGDILGHLILIP